MSADFGDWGSPPKKIFGADAPAKENERERKGQRREEREEKREREERERRQRGVRGEEQMETRHGPILAANPSGQS